MWLKSAVNRRIYEAIKAICSVLNACFLVNGLAGLLCVSDTSGEVRLRGTFYADDDDV